jgi:hypothetical protein
MEQITNRVARCSCKIEKVRENSAIGWTYINKRQTRKSGTQMSSTVTVIWNQQLIQ